MLRIFLSSVWVVIGLILAAVGLESFLIPNHFIDGGITGVSMLVAQRTTLPLPFVLAVMNLPFIVMGYRHLGKEFAFKSGAAILGLVAVLALIEFPVATTDPLLSAVFGGAFLGAGVGLAIRNGAVFDGTEILALLTSMKTFATVGEIILVLNALLFSVAAFFLGLEPAMYSMLTYFAASKTIDYLLHGIEAYQGVLIVTSEPAQVRQAVLTQMGRGVTTFKGKGGYTDHDREILLCIVTRLEVTRLESLVSTLDSQAFIVTLPVLDTHGGMVKRRSFH